MSARDEPNLVVGVGASAGGLEAFKELLSAIPRVGYTLILVQHLHPDHESLLPSLLRPCTQLEVAEGEHGRILKPDTVYVIRPNTMLAVREGRIVLAKVKDRIQRPVDHLFASLAREYAHRACGILLSGAGSDGTLGLREIKSVGGLTIAQHPDEGAQPGMPRSALRAGVVDLELSISEMPVALERFAELPPSTCSPPLPSLEEEEHEGDEGGLPDAPRLSPSDQNRLSALLEAHLDFHLDAYKHATVERRVQRRMALAGISQLPDYFERLRTDELERTTLARDMLIGVTEFFRDPGAYEALRGHLADLVEQSSAGTTLRAWVAGCATGEEAYSLAIELLEARRRVREKRLSVQIFATDVDPQAIDFARRGVYSTTIAEQVGERRLEEYFKLGPAGYQVRAALRDVISFAVHDLTRDPPFSRMHLVSCRNVLIYLRPAAQQQVLRSLHFALQPRGVLLLGSSESTSQQRKLFAVVSKKWRIYRRLGVPRGLRLRSETDATVREISPLASPPARQPRAVAAGPEDAIRRALLRANLPPTLVVDAEGQVLFLHGELRPFLRFPEGEAPRFELTSLLTKEVATRTRSLVYRCRRDGDPVFAEARLGDPPRQVRIGARLLPGTDEGVMQVTFEDVGEAADLPEQAEAPPEQEQLIEELSRELQATREDLRNTVEELETTNEELRSSNEESRSMNEELQSSNEELEATTEELRSLNEELITVNAQLREKVDELERAHDDLSNFFASTRIATLFLDDDLCLARLSPVAEELLGIGAADYGRHVGALARELLQSDLVEEARAVLDDFVPRDREVQTLDGRWLVRRVLPYRTESRSIEGVVVTFLDVTELKRANEALSASARRLDMAWEAARGGIYEHSVPLDETTYHSRHWASVLGYEPAELPEHGGFLAWLYEQVHPDDREAIQASYNDFVDNRRPDYRVEVRLRHKRGNWMWVRGVSKALQRDADGRVKRLIGMMLDVDDLKQAQEALRQSRERFRTMADGLPLFVWLHDAEGDLELVNRTFCEFFAVERDEMNGDRWRSILHPDDAAAYTAEFERCVAQRVPFHAEVRARRADGEWRWMESWGSPRYDARGAFAGMIGSSADVTSRHEAETELRRAEQEQRRLARELEQSQRLESLGLLARGVAHDFNNLLMGVYANAELAQSTLPSDSPSQEHLRRILVAGRRAADLVGQIMNYAAQGAPADVSMSLNEAVEETVALLPASLSASIQVREELAPDLPPIQGDPTQVRQVILNLLFNAAEALQGRAGGWVSLETARCSLSEQELSELASDAVLAPGAYLSLRVRDNGPGIAPADQPRVFDPFFSTKQGGRGLGLSGVYGIVRRHRGALRLESRLGEGAALTVYWPLERVKTPAPSELEEDFAGLRFEGKALVVDDEEEVRFVARRLLERFGLTVLEARGGAEALELFGRHAAELRCVVLDYVMPGMDGAAAFAEMHRLAPEIPVLICSGTTEHGDGLELRDPAPAGFLTKPYGLGRLASKLREILATE